MTDSEMEDLCLLHSALKEKGEGEIKRIKEKYECILRASDIKGRRGEFRGLRGDGHAQAFVNEGHSPEDEDTGFRDELETCCYMVKTAFLILLISIS